MKCPFCGHADDRVLDTRVQKEGDQIRRRRECLSCRERFSTVESIMQVHPLVVKKDGRRETFNKEKILRGIQLACQKRPVSLPHMEQVVERVTKWVIDRYDKEVPAHMIGYKVMKELRVVDDVAYVRFASVYKKFDDINEFVDLVKDDPSVPETENQLPFTLTSPPER
jgi:transcriptional repressor NrdR